MTEATIPPLIGTVVTVAPIALYRLYDVGHRLLYVGISDNPGLRWAQHAATASWWPEVAVKTLQWCPDRRAALDAETAAIATEDPVHNRKRPPAEEMTTRSWYMSREAAERLDRLVGDLHSATGLPRYAVMGALAERAVELRDEIEAEVRALADTA